VLRCVLQCVAVCATVNCSACCSMSSSRRGAVTAPLHSLTFSPPRVCGAVCISVLQHVYCVLHCVLQYVVASKRCHDCSLALAGLFTATCMWCTVHQCVAVCVAGCCCVRCRTWSRRRGAMSPLLQPLTDLLSLTDLRSSTSPSLSFHRHLQRSCTCTQGVVVCCSVL